MTKYFDDRCGRWGIILTAKILSKLLSAAVVMSR